MIRAIIKIGLPTAIGGSTMQLGTLIMTRNVNVYGYIATSAYGIGNKINSLITMPASGVGSAVSTIVGQNMGAGNTERAKKTFHYSLKMCTLFFTYSGIHFFKTPCFPDYGIILFNRCQSHPSGCRTIYPLLHSGALQTLFIMYHRIVPGMWAYTDHNARRCFPDMAIPSFVSLDMRKCIPYGRWHPSGIPL